MARVYPNTTIGPYTGTAIYLDERGQLCEPAQAVRARIVCADGRAAWFTVQKSALREHGTPGEPDYPHGRGARKTAPASWRELSSNPFARRLGWTEEQTTLDWLARNKVERVGDRYVMYHATPAKNTFTDLRAGSYLAQDAETAVGQASRDRGPKAGKIRVHRVEFYPWEVAPSSAWAITRSTLPLGPEVKRRR